MKKAKEHGNRKTFPIIRSMYPSKSRGEMAEEFEDSFNDGYNYAIEILKQYEQLLRDYNPIQAPYSGDLAKWLEEQKDKNTSE